MGFIDWAETKIKRKQITKDLRNQVWIKYLGNKPEGKCYCCNMVTIHFTNFQVGHNKAVAKGGKNQISNLRPICALCNRGMGTKSIESYRKTHFAATTTKTKKKTNVKTTPKKTTTKKKVTKKKLKKKTIKKKPVKRKTSKKVTPKKPIKKKTTKKATKKPSKTVKKVAKKKPTKKKL